MHCPSSCQSHMRQTGRGGLAVLTMDMNDVEQQRALGLANNRSEGEHMKAEVNELDCRRQLCGVTIQAQFGAR